MKRGSERGWEGFFGGLVTNTKFLGKVILWQPQNVNGQQTHYVYATWASSEETCQESRPKRQVENGGKEGTQVEGQLSSLKTRCCHCHCTFGVLIKTKLTCGKWPRRACIFAAIQPAGHSPDQTAHQPGNVSHIFNMNCNKLKIALRLICNYKVEVCEKVKKINEFQIAMYVWR